MVGVGRAATRVFTWLLAVLFGAAVLTLAGAGALAWRLVDGPLDVTWLVPRLAPDGWSAGRLTVQIVPAEQNGAKRGHDMRLQIDDGQRAAMAGEPAQSVRSATVNLALAPLLTGVIAPRDVALDGLRLNVATPRPGAAHDGEEPGLDPQRLLRRLQHLSVTNAQAAVMEGTLGQTLTVKIGAAEATRGEDGVLQAHVAVEAATAGATITADAHGSYGPAGGQVALSVPSVNPAVLARAVPLLQAGSMLDADVALQAGANFGPDLHVTRASVHATSGPGTAQLPAKKGSFSPGHFAALTLDADGTPDKMALRALKLTLVPPSGNPATTVLISGNADRANGRFTAHVAVDVDHVAFADLGALWPENVGGDSRAWLTQNLSAGTAHDGHFAFTLTGTDTGDNLDLPQAGGQVTGDDVTIWWLRPVSPIQHAHAVLVWQSPDVAVVTVNSGKDSGIDIKGGTVRFTGLAAKDQAAQIEADLAGGLGDVITLLKTPRLNLLSAHPLPLSAPSGAVTAHLTVRLPLDATVTIDQVAIHAVGQVANTHLGGIVAGRDLDQGQLAIDVTNDGLRVGGPAQFAHMPAQLALQMDFRDGPKTQVLTHLTASLRVTKGDADKAGLGGIGLDGGTLAANVDYAERRDATSVIQVDTDLTAAKLVTPLGWSKVAGTPGHAAGRALLDHGRLVGLDGLQAEAPGLSVVARSDMVNGYPSVVHLERGEIGRSDATGTIVLPQKEGEPYRITLAGPRLDLEGRLKTTESPAASDTGADPARSGPPYVLDLKFERVVLGPNHGLGPVAVTAVGADGRLTNAHLTTGGAERARADLVTTETGRRLTASAANLGSLLRDTDLATEIDGGELDVRGAFDDRVAGSPFDGTFDLRNFKVQGAPVAGKLLQALTVYGVVDALRGPGLSFDRFETGFRLKGAVLNVTNARAFSSSLGFTATGRLDFGHRQVDMHGTIVPAYFFNSLPGRIPLIGRIFSPEQGSGLFAANYGLTGALSDPSVSINPLSALTPGILRGFFDLF